MVRDRLQILLLIYCDISQQITVRFLYTTESYFEPSQISMKELSDKKKKAKKPLNSYFCRKTPLDMLDRVLNTTLLNPLSTNPTKWSNTLKQFVGNLPTNCLSVFDHFVGLPFKELNFLKTERFPIFRQPQFIPFTLT